MSLARSLEQGPRNAYRSRGCSLGRFRDALKEDERAALDRMIDTRSADGGWEWSHSALARAIDEDADYPTVSMKSNTVSRHRSGQCSCEPG